MLIADRPNTAPTIYLSVGIESLPLLDDCADVVVCRNALDHMHDPALGLAEISRTLKADGRLFLWVDIGGGPSPDEPSPFTRESLMCLLEQEFEVLWLGDSYESHNSDREYSVRILAKRKQEPSRKKKLDRGQLLNAYERSIGK
jgi:SAM-dependent methyltransferase